MMSRCEGVWNVTIRYLGALRDQSVTASRTRRATLSLLGEARHTKATSPMEAPLARHLPRHDRSRSTDREGPDRPQGPGVPRRAGPQVRRAAAGFVAGASLILLTACGGTDTAGSTPGCFRLSQAVEQFNSAQDAAQAGTATDSDTAKAYAGVKDKLDDAAVITQTGTLHDLAVSASTGVGQARVALLSGGSAVPGVKAALTALNSVVPMCNGK